jgi:hypothetical protein
MGFIRDMSDLKGIVANVGVRAFSLSSPFSPFFFDGSQIVSFVRII